MALSLVQQRRFLFCIIILLPQFGIYCESLVNYKLILSFSFIPSTVVSFSQFACRLLLLWDKRRPSLSHVWEGKSPTAALKEPRISLCYSSGWGRLLFNSMWAYRRPGQQDYSLNYSIIRTRPKTSWLVVVIVFSFSLPGMGVRSCSGRDEMNGYGTSLEEKLLFLCRSVPWNIKIIWAYLSRKGMKFEEIVISLCNILFQGFFLGNELYAGFILCNPTESFFLIVDSQIFWTIFSIHLLHSCGWSGDKLNDNTVNLRIHTLMPSSVDVGQ